MTQAAAAMPMPRRRSCGRRKDRGAGCFGNPGHDVFEGLPGVEPGFRKAGVSPGFVSPEKGVAVGFGCFEPLLQFPAFRVGEGCAVQLAGYQIFDDMFGSLHSIYITDESAETLPPPVFFFRTAGVNKKQNR